MAKIGINFVIYNITVCYKRKMPTWFPSNWHSNKLGRVYYHNLLSLNQSDEWNDGWNNSGSLDSTLFPRKQWNRCTDRSSDSFLLICAFPWKRFPVASVRCIQQFYVKLTAAGLFRIWTWFPFNCIPGTRRIQTNALQR